MCLFVSCGDLRLNEAEVVDSEALPPPSPRESKKSAPQLPVLLSRKVAERAPCVGDAPEPAQSDADVTLKCPQEVVSTRSSDRQGVADREETTRAPISSRSLSNASASYMDTPMARKIDPMSGLRSIRSTSVQFDDVFEKYVTVQRLGEGSFGTVHLVKRVDTGEIFAMKSVPVKSIREGSRVAQELKIARRTRHPYVISLYETFQQDKNHHLVMELCSGGDLYTAVKSSKRRVGDHSVCGLRAEQVAHHAWQMLSGIAYLHHYSICHRDIKPENYMLASPAKDAPVKLIDFGLARSFQKGVYMTSKVGSLHYVAPEVINPRFFGYTAKCDIWSIGVSLWFLSVASHPFECTSQYYLKKKVMKAEYDFDFPLWHDVHSHPAELRELVAQLMEKDPTKRPCAKTVLLRNEWLNKASPNGVAGGDKSCCTIS